MLVYHVVSSVKRGHKLKKLPLALFQAVRVDSTVKDVGRRAASTVLEN